MQPRWDQYEVALLIDMCLQVENKLQTKQLAVKTLSEQLRNRAILQGKPIDNIFRNENGIAIQMSKMNYLLTEGKYGLPGASKLYSDMILLKWNDSTTFEKILLEAKEQKKDERNESKVMALSKEMFIQWLNEQSKLKGSPRGIVSALDEASEYATKHGVSKISFWEITDAKEYDYICRKLLGMRLFRVTHRKTALFLDKVYDYYRSFLLVLKNTPALENTQGNGKYCFNHKINSKTEEQTIDVCEVGIRQSDKKDYICVLMERYRNGMQFDSIDIENFRATYRDLFEKEIDFSDEQLIKRLKLCGIIYKDRLFPAEGIIDNATKDKLFSYIDGSFASGNKVLYYKSIFADLSDTLAYCFTLYDEKMLKAYIEFTAEKGKYYFYNDFMSTEKDVKIDATKEITDFMLAAGKPLSYDEIYAGLSHISNSIIYREIQINPCFRRNEKEHYFHIDIFEFSEDDEKLISSLLDKEIDENGYAIWSNVFSEIQKQMPIFLENNLYLSSLGIRNALSRHMSDKYNFDNEVISTHDKCLSMADVYSLYGKHHAPFSDDDLYAFSKEIGSVIYFSSLAKETVRVSRKLFISKDAIRFDVAAVDAALETYLSSGYILAKDVDSFLVFPNVGYEWNEFLLESYLHNYSEKFALLNNGSCLNNVAGAIVKKNGEYTQFVDICADALATSGLELKKETALNYLADINLITRRSYRELDTALINARQIRNRKG